MKVAQGVPTNFIEGYIASVNMNINFMQIAYDHYGEVGDTTAQRVAHEKLKTLNKKLQALIKMDTGIKNQMLAQLKAEGDKDGRE